MLKKLSDSFQSKNSLKEAEQFTSSPTNPFNQGTPFDSAGTPRRKSSSYEVDTEQPPNQTPKQQYYHEVRKLIAAEIGKTNGISGQEVEELVDMLYFTKEKEIENFVNGKFDEKTPAKNIIQQMTKHFSKSISKLIDRQESLPVEDKMGDSIMEAKKYDSFIKESGGSLPYVQERQEVLKIAKKFGFKSINKRDVPKKDFWSSLSSISLTLSNGSDFLILFKDGSCTFKIGDSEQKLNQGSVTGRDWNNVETWKERISEPVKEPKVKGPKFTKFIFQFESYRFDDSDSYRIFNGQRIAGSTQKPEPHLSSIQLRNKPEPGDLKHEDIPGWLERILNERYKFQIKNAKWAPLNPEINGKLLLPKGIGYGASKQRFIEFEILTTQLKEFIKFSAWYMNNHDPIVLNPGDVMKPGEIYPK